MQRVDWAPRERGLCAPEAEPDACRAVRPLILVAERDPALGQPESDDAAARVGDTAAHSRPWPVRHQRGPAKDWAVERYGRQLLLPA